MLMPKEDKTCVFYLQLKFDTAKAYTADSYAYSYCKVLSGFNVISSPATATLNISIVGLEILIHQEFTLALSQLRLIISNIGELI